MNNDYEIYNGKVVGYKKNRDNFLFSRNEMIMHDRNFIDDRKKNYEKPFQNEYIQKYHINDLNTFNTPFHMEQIQVDRKQKERVDAGEMNLQRNKDMQVYSNNFFDGLEAFPRAVNTRDEKNLLNHNRPPIPKTTGYPVYK